MIELQGLNFDFRLSEFTDFEYKNRTGKKRRTAPAEVVLQGNDQGVSFGVDSSTCGIESSCQVDITDGKLWARTILSSPEGLLPENNRHLILGHVLVDWYEGWYEGLKDKVDKDIDEIVDALEYDPQAPYRGKVRKKILKEFPLLNAESADDSIILQFWRTLEMDEMLRLTELKIQDYNFDWDSLTLQIWL